MTRQMIQVRRKARCTPGSTSASTPPTAISQEARRAGRLPPYDRCDSTSPPPASESIVGVPRSTENPDDGSNGTKSISWRDLPRKDQLIVITLTRLSEPLVQTSLQVRRGRSKPSTLNNNVPATNQISPVLHASTSSNGLTRLCRIRSSPVKPVCYTPVLHPPSSLPPCYGAHRGFRSVWAKDSDHGWSRRHHDILSRIRLLDHILVCSLLPIHRRHHERKRRGDANHVSTPEISCFSGLTRARMADRVN